MTTLPGASRPVRPFLWINELLDQLDVSVRLFQSELRAG